MFFFKFTQRVTILQTVSNQEVTLKRLISMLRIAPKLYVGGKVIYARCINCSYNNVAKGIRLLNEKAFLFIQERFHASKSFSKIYPLKIKQTRIH